MTMKGKQMYDVNAVNEPLWNIQSLVGYVQELHWAVFNVAARDMDFMTFVDIFAIAYKNQCRIDSHSLKYERNGKKT